MLKVCVTYDTGRGLGPARGCGDGGRALSKTSAVSSSRLEARRRLAASALA